MKNNCKLATATWCGPCKTLKANLESEGIEVEMLDIDENSEYVQKMGIRSVPTLIVNDQDLITSSEDILYYLKEENR
jgi:glutaredoxin